MGGPVARTTTSKLPRGKGQQGIRRYLAGLAPVPVPPSIAWGDNWAWLATQIAVAGYTAWVERRVSAWHRDQGRVLVRRAWG